MSNYIGRFAPSPTGPLHFGSLVAALGSYLQARTQGGHWWLRMEDVDTPRTVPGAAEQILRQLEHSGFEWDGEVMWQSTRGEAYEAALAALREKNLIYPCGCSRREIADSTLARDGSHRYAGTCREGLAAGKSARAWRLRTDAQIVRFVDAVQGEYAEDVWHEVGDFVLRRADDLVAYQLAVVVDDAAQGVTQVVRGADLLDSTPRQIYLQHALGYATPSYVHLPVATNAAGEKLSKQTLAQAFDDTRAVPALVQALDFLGQKPPWALANEPLTTFWAWAQAHWNLDAVPKVRAKKLLVDIEDRSK